MCAIRVDPELNAALSEIQPRVPERVRSISCLSLWPPRRGGLAGARSARFDGSRYRRRHLRGRGDFAERHRLRSERTNGGDKFDEAITQYIRRNYGILIGEATAERIKIEIGLAYPGGDVRHMTIRGRNLSEGMPREFTITSNEVLQALEEPLQTIVGAVRQALERTPPISVAMWRSAASCSLAEVRCCAT